VIWLLQDFDFLSVLLRALTLSLEALVVGGVLFLMLVSPLGTAELSARAAVRRFTARFALTLAIAQMLSAAEGCASLVANGVALHEALNASFFIADCAIVALAFALFCLLRFLRESILLSFLIGLILVMASVTLSHATSQLHHRVFLFVLTAAHHLGAAAWMGAMPALLVALKKSEDAKKMHILAVRFSAMAIAGVAVLILAGVGLSYVYVASWQGLYGTSYGVMLMAKVYLMLLALTLGASNYFLVRRTHTDAAPLLIRLRRFSEAEIGLGFTAILAAASLTAQSPARDLGPDQVTGHELVQRLKWEWPTLQSPTFAQLTKRLPLKTELENDSFSGGSDNDAMDRAWSEYNHHWAGLIVLAAGLFAFIAGYQRQQWARSWPLLFFALAIFILLRADPETWPLGPRPFWASFAEPDVLQHRMFALLISAFAVFEWCIETGRLESQWAALIFPALCALGGALLLTHMHGFGGDEKNEMLVGLSHSAIAVLGVTAGWARWLQIRLPDRKVSRYAAWVWPLCFIVVGVLLLDYREA
jgi:putative copper resistance protein D